MMVHYLLIPNIKIRGNYVDDKPKEIAHQQSAKYWNKNPHVFLRVLSSFKLNWAGNSRKNFQDWQIIKLGEQQRQQIFGYWELETRRWKYIGV